MVHPEAALENWVDTVVPATTVTVLVVGWLEQAEPVGDGYRVLASVEGVEVESTSRVSGLGSVGRASTLSGSSGESNGSTTKTWLARFLESVTLAVNEDNTGQITSLGRAENPERSTGSVSGGDNNILRGAGS